MSDDCDEVLFKGDYYQIYICAGGHESLRLAVSKVAPTAKRTKIVRWLYRDIEALANHGSTGLPLGSLATEAQLPSGSHFYALKRAPIRAYFWKSDTPRNLYISHFAYKDQQKLKAKDKNKLIKNWKRVERNG